MKLTGEMQKKMKQTYDEKAGDKRPVWIMKADGSNAKIVEVLHYQCAMDGSRAVISFPLFRSSQN